jgi:hypothetical protein
VAYVRTIKGRVVEVMERVVILNEGQGESSIQRVLDGLSLSVIVELFA